MSRTDGEVDFFFFSVSVRNMKLATAQRGGRVDGGRVDRYLSGHIKRHYDGYLCHFGTVRLGDKVFKTIDAIKQRGSCTCSVSSQC